MEAQKLFDLSGKTAIVTGGGIGLGHQIALALAEVASNIVICSRKLEKCEETAHEIETLGRKALAFRCDISKEEEIKNVVENSIEDFGKIDILVNNSGRTWGGPAEEFPLEQWTKARITTCFSSEDRISMCLRTIRPRTIHRLVR